MHGRTDNAVKNRFNTLSRKNSLDLLVYDDRDDDNEDADKLLSPAPRKRSSIGVNKTAGAKKKMKVGTTPKIKTVSSATTTNLTKLLVSKETASIKSAVSASHDQHPTKYPSTPSTVPKSLAYVSACLSQTTSQKKRHNSSTQTTSKQHKIADKAMMHSYSFNNPVIKYQTMPHMFHRALYPSYFLDNTMKPKDAPVVGLKVEKPKASNHQPGRSLHTTTAAPLNAKSRTIPSIVSPRDEENQSKNDDRKPTQPMPSFKIDENTAIVDKEPLVPLPYFPTLPDHPTNEAKFWDFLSPCSFLEGKHVSLPPLDGEVSEFLSQSFTEGGPALGVLV